MCDTFGDRGFTHARLTYQNRVVLGPPRKNLQNPADLFVTADHRIEFAFAGLFVQVDRIFAQRVESLFVSLRIDRRTFAQLLNRCDHLLFLYAGIFQ